MGLLDFIKKQKPIQSSETQQDIISSPKPTYNEVSNQEVVTQTTLSKTSIKPDEPTPLNILLKSATPSKQGLYPHEILMLEYAPRFKTSNNQFQNFWYWQYSVTDPQSVLDSLLERGFIKKGDLKSALEKLKLPEIKEELKQLNQKVTGKKSELIDRLINSADLSVLNKKYSERYYALTSKGEQELKENQYVSYLHRNRYMTVWEMNQRIAQTHYPFKDILLEYFTEQSNIHFQNFDFGLYSNDCLNIYKLLMEKNNTKTAFHMLCELLLLDLSGLSNNDDYLFECKDSNPELYLEIYRLRFQYFFPYEKSTLIIPPAVLSWFQEMQAILGLDDNDYKKAIMKELQVVHLPYQIFTNEECVDIIIANIHNDTTTLVTIYKKAEKRENERLKEIMSKIK